MSKRLLILLLAGMTLSVIWVSAAFAQFDDVPTDHWAYDAVEYLADEGFVVGYPDGTFKGDRQLTRYEFAMVIVRIYDQFLDLLDEGAGAEIDNEAILNMLMEEFQPEIDELTALIQSNTDRIDALEGTVGGFDERIAAVEELADGLQTNFHPYGDLGLRFYGTYPENGMQTQRPQFSLHFGFDADINDELTMGARFSSGVDNGRTTTYQTQNDAFGFDEVTIDKAYLMWQPEQYEGFTMWAGKFAPPWITTPMVWDSDVTVEGLAQRMNWNNFNFYLGELVPAEQGFYLVAQASVDDLFVEDSTLAVTYHYINDEAWQSIAADMQSGALVSKWNFARLQSPDDYRAIEAYWDWTHEVMDVPFKVRFNYLHNLEDTAPGLQEEAGWQRAAWASVTLFDLKPVEPGDWNVWGEWGRLQPNSVLSWMTDSTRGSGDNEFWVAGIKYQLLYNTDVQIYYVNMDRLSSPSTTEMGVVQFTSYFK